MLASVFSSQVLLSPLRKKPSLQAHENPPGLFTQICSQSEIPSAHSSTSTQTGFKPSFWRSGLNLLRENSSRNFFRQRLSYYCSVILILVSVPAGADHSLHQHAALLFAQIETAGVRAFRNTLTIEQSILRATVGPGTVYPFAISSSTLVPSFDNVRRGTLKSIRSRGRQDFIQSIQIVSVLWYHVVIFDVILTGTQNRR